MDLPFLWNIFLPIAIMHILRVSYFMELFFYRNNAGFLRTPLLEILLLSMKTLNVLRATFSCEMRYLSTVIMYECGSIFKDVPTVLLEEHTGQVALKCFVNEGLNLTGGLNRVYRNARYDWLRKSSVHCSSVYQTSAWLNLEGAFLRLHVYTWSLHSMLFPLEILLISGTRHAVFLFVKNHSKIRWRRLQCAFVFHYFNN